MPDIIVPAPLMVPTGNPTTPAPATVTAVDSWKELLPEDLRAHSAFEPYQKFNSVKEFIPEIAKAYVNSQKLIGQKSAVAPGVDAKPEEWLTWKQSLGAPKDPAGYQVVKEMEGKVPDAVVDQIRDFGVKNGFTQREFQSALGYYADLYAKVPEMCQQSLKDKYSANPQAIEVINKGFERALGLAFVPEDIRQEVMETAAYNPAVRELLAIFASKFNESVLVESPTTPGVNQLEDLQKQITNVQNRKNGLYQMSLNDHVNRNAEMEALAKEEEKLIQQKNELLTRNKTRLR